MDSLLDSKLIKAFVLLVVLFSLENTRADITKIEWGKVVANCPMNNRPKIYIIKQSAIAYDIDTKTAEVTAADQSQMQNQRNVYSMLDTWITQGKINFIMGEGCSRQPIDKTFTKTFNAWGFNELKEKSSSENYIDIATHIPMKLAAKYEGKVTVECGDDEELFLSQKDELEDMQRVITLLGRLRQYQQDPKKLPIYMKATVETYELDKFMTPKKVMDYLETRLRETLRIWNSVIAKREDVLSKNIMSKGLTMAVVVDGMHALKLKKLLQAEKFQCTVIEPVGYNRIHERVQKNFEKLLK